MPRPIQSDIQICASKKVGFLPFIDIVINSNAEMERKSQKIDVKLEAAKKYMGV